MALKDLLAALEADAAAETERLRAEAGAEALRIVESAQLEARAREEQAVQADEAELRRELARRRSEVRLAAAAMLRGEHEACVATLQAALRRRLETVRESEAYPAVLRALIEESLAAIPSASLLRVDPRDLELARGIVSDLDVRLDLKPELVTIGGVEAVDGDGLTVRDTLEERLRNAEAALRVLASELLETAAPTVAEEAVS
jgi:V/A-type H+/Na+-transporting ATPase subunit E